MRVLAVEGTAWAASAAIYDVERGTISIETDPYVPESGGIHPREAAEHMQTAVPRVIETVLDREATDRKANGNDRTESHPVEGIDAVAFSRGPGLGPCLRIVASAARAFALTREIPLVGVNHMIAHAEIGRHQSGFEAPICLNASGANAHVLAYRNGRYRVLGETMDTGVGNAIDKFARHLGWGHPGGPKVERKAREGSYYELPYVVKGMDFSFSGLMSAAKEAVDSGVPVEDVCCSLQETVFAMLTEVSERALSLTDADELVLGGGVGQNARLRGMLETMSEARGARFFAPEPRLLGDNAGMIAVLGARMAAAGDTLSIPDSRVRSTFRPDEVPVTWPVTEPGSRSGADARATPSQEKLQGAEATVSIGSNRVVKRRPEKGYRHPALDDRLRRERTVLEARLTSAARRLGIPTPVIDALDTRKGEITFERVGDVDLRDLLVDRDRSDRSAVAGEAVEAVGGHLATLHNAGIVHGDPTTRNVRVSVSEGTNGQNALGRTILIDFGLGFYTDAIEDYAMDCHVLAQSLTGTAGNADRLRERFERAYAEAGDTSAVLDRLEAIEGRGRYR